MKKLLLLFLALTAVFLPLAAQDWAPFKIGRTPYFSSGYKVHSLKIADAALVGSDSIFTFNPVVGPSLVGGEYSRHDDNIFGWKMKKSFAGNYEFIFSAGDTAKLNPNAALGAPHVFMGQQNLTITLISRSLETINNQADSVLTYLLSNGDTLQLSKSFGLLRTRSFQSYLQPNLDTTLWELYRLPEAGMGQAPNSAFKIFDFQPGDKFLYRSKQSFIGVPCELTDYTFEVLSRYNSPAGDSIKYSFRTQRLIKTTNSGFCESNGAIFNPNGTVLTNLDTVDFVVTDAAYPFLMNLSYEYSPLFQDGFINVNWGFSRNPVTGRISIGFNGLYHISSSASFGFLSSSGESYAEGLGLVQSDFYHESNSISGEGSLVAYIKGAETYGNWQPLVLSAEEELKENPLQVYPNPFTNELTIKLPEQTSADITIYNLQGQKMRVLQTKNEAKIELPNLSSGLYLLHVQQGEKSYTQKVQKQ